MIRIKYRFKNGKNVVPEILILIHCNKFLMNKIKMKLLTKNSSLTKEIRIFTC